HAKRICPRLLGCGARLRQARLLAGRGEKDRSVWVPGRRREPELARCPPERDFGLRPLELAHCRRAWRRREASPRGEEAGDRRGEWTSLREHRPRFGAHLPPSAQQP